MKKLIVVSLLTLSTAFCASTNSTQKIHYNHYIPWGTTTFSNKVTVPLYSVTDDGPFGNYDYPPDKHHLYYNFVLPNNQQGKFVTFSDFLGIALIPKGMVPVNSNTSSDSSSITYIGQNGEKIKIIKSASYLTSYCFSNINVGDVLHFTQKCVQLINRLPNMHVVSVHRPNSLSNRTVLTIDKINPQTSEKTTIVLSYSRNKEVDITLPNSENNLKKTLIDFYSKWVSTNTHSMCGGELSCNRYILYGNTTFKNNIILPLYGVTNGIYVIKEYNKAFNRYMSKGSKEFNDAFLPKKHHLYSSFIIPKNQANKLVTFYDVTGLNLLPKGVFPVDNTVSLNMPNKDITTRNIVYTSKDRKKRIIIINGGSFLNNPCFNARWFRDYESIQICKSQGLPPSFYENEKKHLPTLRIDFINYKNKSLIATYKASYITGTMVTLPKPEKVTVLINNNRGVFIALPDDMNDIRNTLVKFYEHKIHLHDSKF